MGILKELVKKLGKEPVEDPEDIKAQEKEGEEIAAEIASRLMPRRDFVQRVDVSAPPVEMPETEEGKEIQDQPARDDDGDER